MSINGASMKELPGLIDRLKKSANPDELTKFLKSKSAKSLDLTQCLPNHHALFHILMDAAAQAEITELALNLDEIGEDGAEIICANLKKTKISKLCLSSCFFHISPESAQKCAPLLYDTAIIEVQLNPKTDPTAISLFAGATQHNADVLPALNDVFTPKYKSCLQAAP